MIGYVAKNKDNTLYLYDAKPEYDKKYEIWTVSIEYFNITGQFPEFDNMSYKDDPVKVEIKLERV